MRCPKCGALIPRRRMLFSDVFRGFNCESCSTALQATYLSRLTLIGLSFVAAVFVAQSVRAAGVGGIVLLLTLILTFLGVYLIGAGFVPRIRIQPERPRRPG